MNAKDRKRVGTKPYSYPNSSPSHKGAQGSGSSGGMSAKGTVGSGSTGSDTCKGAMGMSGRKGY